MDEKISKLIRDLFVKIKPVFTKDLYIIKNKYMIAGKLSDKKSSGDYLIMIEDKYSEALDNLLDKNKSYYVSDVIKVKDNFNDYISELNEKDSLKLYNDELIDLLNLFSGDYPWISLGDNKELVESIYSKKTLYNIKTDSGVTVTIGKPILPVVTEKTIGNLYMYLLDNSDDKLKTLLLDFKFTHFRLCMKYTFLNI